MIGWVVEAEFLGLLAFLALFAFLGGRLESPVDALGDPNVGPITHVVSLLWSAIPRTTESSLHHATSGLFYS